MSSRSDERYDFFLSRRGSVAAIAREVTDVLTEKGYKVFVQDYDIPLTANFIEEMHEDPYAKTFNPIRLLYRQRVGRSSFVVAFIVVEHPIADIIAQSSKRLSCGWKNGGLRCVNRGKIFRILKGQP
jgi:hypothetical protein